MKRAADLPAAHFEIRECDCLTVYVSELRRREPTARAA